MCLKVPGGVSGGRVWRGRVWRGRVWGRVVVLRCVEVENEVISFSLRREDVHSIRGHVTTSSHDLCCFCTFFKKCV